MFLKAGKLALEAQMQGSKTFENLVHIGKEEALEPYKSGKILVTS